MRRIGPYEVVSELGRGGMGVVFRARTPDGRGEVAVKVLTRRGRDADATVRFARERDMLLDLGTASGFVPLLDWGEHDGHPFIVMPLLAGGTMRDRLAGPIAVSEAVALVRELARVVGRAHERGIVHRDLKPENVLFDAAGRLHVADLGLAKSYHPDPYESLGAISRTGELRGTVGYMAPEQVRDAKSVDARADVFSLGAILYESLAGVAPFEGETMLEVIGRIERGEVRELAALRPEVPGWLAAVARRALDPDPSRRFATAGDLAAALEPREGERRRWPLVLGFVLALGLGGVALARIQRPAPAPPPAPPPSSFPPEARPFERAGVATLAGVLGSYELKHAARVRAVAFSPDGKRGLSASEDGFARVWDLATGTAVASCRDHGGPALGAVFVRGGSHVVSAGADGRLQLWDAATGAVERTLEGHGATVRALVATPDGETVISAGDDGTVRVWDARTGRRRATFPPEGRVLAPDRLPRALAVSPEGNRGAVALASGEICVWDLAMAKLLATFGEPASDVLGVAFLTDGRIAAAPVGPEGELVRAPLWDVAERTSRRRYSAPLTALAASRTQPIVVAADPTGKVRLSHVEKERDLLEIELRVRIHAVALSPDGKRALAGAEDHAVYVLDLETKAVRPAKGGHLGGLNAVVVAPDGKRAITGGADGRIVVWDLAAGKDGDVFQGPGIVVALALAKDRCLIADANALVHDLPLAGDDFKEPRALPAEALRPLPRAALHASGRVAFPGANGTIFFWNLAEPGVSPAIAAHAPSGIACFSADGRHVLIGGPDGELSYDGLVAGAVGATLPGHGRRIVALALSPDGRRALSSGDDGSLKVWDLAQKIDVAALELVPARALAFAPEGRRALLAGADGSVHLIDLDRAVSMARIDLAAAGDHARDLAFLPDGESFLIATGRGVLLRFSVPKAHR